MVLFLLFLVIFWSAHRLEKFGSRMGKWGWLFTHYCTDRRPWTKRRRIVSCFVCLVWTKPKQGPKRFSFILSAKLINPACRWESRWKWYDELQFFSLFALDVGGEAGGAVTHNMFTSWTTFLSFIQYRCNLFTFQWLNIIALRQAQAAGIVFRSKTRQEAKNSS